MIHRNTSYTLIMVWQRLKKQHLFIASLNPFYHSSTFLFTSNVAQTPLTLYWKKNSTIQIKWSIASCRISSIHLCLFQIYLYVSNAHSLDRIISSNESIAVKIKTSCAHPMDSLTRHCCLKRTFGEPFKSATNRSSAPLTASRFLGKVYLSNWFFYSIYNLADSFLASCEKFLDLK